MKNRTQILSVLVIAMLAAGTAFAAPQLDTLALGNGMAFSTDFTYDNAFIRVTGPNGFRQDVKVVGGGDLAITFDRALADGLYKWQLLVVEPLSAEVQAAMQKARSLEKGARQFDVASHKFTGTFSVAGGALATPVEKGLDDRDLATKDQVILDDLIVDGSLCVGFDCVNGESFGSDTIRIKENNTRLHFDDTSNSASFPANDWRFIANDNSNGGASYMAIQDATAGRIPFLVEAGARANALYVEADGDVGVGTSNPVVEMHIVRGDTPTIRLEQDGSSGFTPQSYDVAANEANFFIRDVTNGSRLFFRSNPGAPESSIHIQGNGDVGLGTASAKAPLHVVASGGTTTPSNNATVAFFQNTAAATDGAIMGLQSGNNANGQFWFGDTDDDNAGRVIYRHGAPDVMSFFTAGDERVRIDAQGDTCIGCGLNDIPDDFQVVNGGTTSALNAGDTTFTVTSSREAKKNIQPVEGGDVLAKISQVGVFTYDYIDGPENKLGLIAEDFHQIFGRGSDKVINGQEVQMALWLAIQELTAQNRELQKRLEQLETQDEVE